MIYRTCQYCGANLDPGETCDCRQAAEEQAAERQRIHDEVQIRLVAFMERLKQEQAQQAAEKALRIEGVRADLLRSLKTIVTTA